MNKTIIAIDPGVSGGFACQHPGEEVTTENMPRTLRDIVDLLEVMKKDTDVFCIMEKVFGFMPGNGGASAAKFAEHIGALKMALIALKIPHELVLPKKWMDTYVGRIPYPDSLSTKDEHGVKRKGVGPKRKTFRKNFIKAESQRRFPHLKVTLATADALGLLAYAQLHISSQDALPLD